MSLISSRNNPKIKSVRALQQRKARRATHSFLVEGIRHVGEAVESGACIEAIYYAPDLLDSEFAHYLINAQSETGVHCYATSTEVFRSLAERQNPQGILAVVRQQGKRLDQLTPDNFPWGVALVSPQDPGNVGTILRCLDAVGASGLLLLGESVDPYHPSAIRASMGTLFWYPVVIATFAEFTNWISRHSYHVYGTSAKGTVDFRDIEEYLFPRILLMGDERRGLTSDQAAFCERLICIPMRGRATSLNLAVATGIMLYSMIGENEHIT